MLLAGLPVRISLGGLHALRHFKTLWRFPSVQAGVAAHDAGHPSGACQLGITVPEGIGALSQVRAGDHQIGKVVGGCPFPCRAAALRLQRDGGTSPLALTEAEHHIGLLSPVDAVQHIAGSHYGAAIDIDTVIGVDTGILAAAAGGGDDGAAVDD